MRYESLKNFILVGLESTPYEGVAVIPGPDERVAPPTRFLMLSGIGGPGLNTENLFDARSYQVLAAGEQGSFDDAEGLAYAVDAVFIDFYTRQVDGLWVTSIIRQGGPPTPLNVDDADRTRFTCNYIIDARSSVA